jgi:hypothetical protein
METEFSLCVLNNKRKVDKLKKAIFAAIDFLPDKIYVFTITGQRKKYSRNTHT